MDEELRASLKQAEKVAQKAYSEWVEEACAGLLAAGVPRGDIMLKVHPDFGTVRRTEILVRGVPKYGFTIWLEQIEDEKGYIGTNIKYRDTLFIGPIECPHIPGVRHE